MSDSFPLLHINQQALREMKDRLAEEFMAANPSLREQIDAQPDKFEAVNDAISEFFGLTRSEA